MGLYNMVHGTNALAPIVIALLERPPSFFGRLRDAWIEKNEHGEIRIAVYTRNGGGNREDQADAWDSIRSHPLYLSDQDDSYDCTYATAYFKLPDKMPAAVLEGIPEGHVMRDWGRFVENLKECAIPAPNMQERWMRAAEAIRGGK